MGKASAGTSQKQEMRPYSYYKRDKEIYSYLEHGRMSSAYALPLDQQIKARDSSWPSDDTQKIPNLQPNHWCCTNIDDWSIVQHFQVVCPSVLGMEPFGAILLHYLVQQIIPSLEPTHLAAIL